MHRPDARTLASLLLALAAAACGSPFGSDDEDLAPSVGLSAPAAGQAVEADSVVVTGLARDDREVRGLAYRLDDGVEQAVVVEPSAQVAFRFVVRGLSLGAHELEVLATDERGGIGSARASFSSSDATPPELTVESPAEGALAHRDSVRVTGAASDARGVAALSYRLDDGPEAAVETEPGAEAGFDLVLRPEPGEHVLVLRARDAAGNVGERTVRFTTAAARVRFTAPRPDTLVRAYAVELQGDIESDVPVARIAFSYDGGAEIDSPTALVHRPADAAPDQFRFSVVADALPQGRSEVRVHAYDAGGALLGRGSLPVRSEVAVRRYALGYLGTLGGSDSRGVELNERSQVAGWSYAAGDAARRAFAWDGGPIDLGADLGTASWAGGINEDGVVVGGYDAACRRGFVRRLDGEAEGHPVLEECGHEARDVNDAGTILLSRPAPDGALAVEAFLLGASGLRPLQEGDAELRVVVQVNDREEVLGGLAEPFFGVVPALLSTGRPPVAVGACVPGDLSDRGELALPSGCRSALFGRNGSVAGRALVSIGPPPPASVTNPAALNGRAEAAGLYRYSLRADGASPRVDVRPFFWDGERMHDVQYDAPDWRIDAVDDLNDAGVILAHGVNERTGERGAVLLVPVE